MLPENNRQKGKHQVLFVFGNGHLDPRGLTIPKLELEAAVLAARLDKLLEMELSLKIDKSDFWSDSMATLQCIYNCKKKHPVYVARRIAEIDNCSDKNDWNYVPTAENPANDVTRGQSVKQFLKSKRWLTGPEFLLKDKKKWPSQIKRSKDSETASELDVMPNKQAAVTSLSCATSRSDPELSPVERLISHYSTLNRLKKGIAWTLKFGKHLFNNTCRVTCNTNVSNCCLTVDELKSMESRGVSRGAAGTAVPPPPPR